MSQVILLGDEWSGAWEAFTRMLGGSQDVMGRQLVCTPYDGQYGRAGWILCVNGSPPRGTVLLASGSESPERCVYFDGSRAKRVPAEWGQAKAWWAFHREHLVRAKGPVIFRLASRQE